jgi:hypothetical protein
VRRFSAFVIVASLLTSFVLGWHAHDVAGASGDRHLTNACATCTLAHTPDAEPPRFEVVAPPFLSLPVSEARHLALRSEGCLAFAPKQGPPTVGI